MTVKYLSDGRIHTIENVDIITNLEDSNELCIDSNKFTKSTKIKVNQLIIIKN